MFIGRETELAELQNELKSRKRKTAILVYGKRRVGKSTLINKAAESTICASPALLKVTCNFYIKVSAQR